jgi:hypothetical protein
MTYGLPDGPHSVLALIEPHSLVVVVAVAVGEFVLVLVAAGVAEVDGIVLGEAVAVELVVALGVLVGETVVLGVSVTVAVFEGVADAVGDGVLVEVSIGVEVVEIVLLGVAERDGLGDIVTVELIVDVAL